MTTINTYLQEATNKLMDECNVFWAFGTEQFKEGISKLKESGALLEGEKVTEIGAGGFMPSKNVKKYVQGHKDIQAEYKRMKKDAKARTDYILYELHNHEVFYTGDVNTFCSTYMADIPKDEIISVYKSHNKSKCGCNK